MLAKLSNPHVYYYYLTPLPSYCGIGTYASLGFISKFNVVGYLDVTIHSILITLSSHPDTLSAHRLHGSTKRF